LWFCEGVLLWFHEEALLSAASGFADIIEIYAENLAEEDGDAFTSGLGHALEAT
jgi:hypothetical protein